MFRQMKCFLLQVVGVLAVGFCLGSGHAAAEEPEPILISPGDRVEVTVLDHETLNGDYMVDATGSVRMPVIGPVEIANLTEEDATQRVRDLLQAGFVKNPEIALRLTELRPVYVTGYVASPGPQPFRYGTTTLMAIAQAGGYFRAPSRNLWQTAGDLVDASHRVTAGESERAELILRIARLEAQLEGKEALDAVDVSPLGPKDWAAEEAQLRADRRLLEEEIALIDDQRPRLEEAREALKRQVVAEEERIEVIDTRLGRLQSLESRGLAGGTALFDVEREKAASKSSVAGLHSELAFLGVRLGDLDLSVHQARAAFDRRTRDALDESRRQLRAAEIRLAAARDLFSLRRRQAGQERAAGAQRKEPQFQISVVRRHRDGETEFEATETTLVQPGDVVLVEFLEDLDDAVPLLPQESSVGRGALHAQREQDVREIED